MFFSSKRVPRSQQPVAKLGVERLEDRTVPAGYFFTGVGGITSPAEPFARVYDTSSATGSSVVLSPPGNISAFPGFNGAVRVAAGDINGDGTDDIICAQGPSSGAGSQVRVFDGAGALTGAANVIASFFAYSNAAGASQTPGYGGGVFVAAADFNNDGVDELVTSPGFGARGHVKVFDFNSGGTFLGSAPALRASFFAYTDFAGEIRVTTLTRTIGGVRTPFLVTASGAGTSQCDVRLYANAAGIGQVADLTLVPPAVQFFPFPGYTGGVSVAAGDTDADLDDELFVSKNNGISAVRVFDVSSVVASGSSQPAPQAEFQAFDGFNGEVRLGAANVDGFGGVEVLTSTGSSPGAGGSHVKAWSVSGSGVALSRSFFAYQGYVGGVWLSTKDFTTTQTFRSADTPAAIPDDATLASRSTISIAPNSPLGLVVRPKAVAVTLNIAAQSGAASNEDLDVFLQAPDGTQLELFSDVNGGGSGFGVRLDDRAATAIDAAAPGAPLTGTFRPEASASLIAAFRNSPIAGTWRLVIRDDAATDVYTLTSWSLTFSF